MLFRCSAYLRGGHDIAFLAIEFRAADRSEAENMFRRAMRQLGFKPRDYNSLTVSPDWA